MLSHCAVVAEELLRRCCASVGAELKKTAQTAGDEVDTNTARVKTRAAFLLHLAPLNAVLPATTAALEGEGKALEDSVQEVTTAWHQKLPPASQSTPAPLTFVSASPRTVPQIATLLIAFIMDARLCQVPAVSVTPSGASTYLWAKRGSQNAFTTLSRMARLQHLAWLQSRVIAARRCAIFWLLPARPRTRSRCHLSPVP